MKVYMRRWGRGGGLFGGDVTNTAQPENATLQNFLGQAKNGLVYCPVRVGAQQDWPLQHPGTGERRLHAHDPLEDPCLASP